MTLKVLFLLLFIYYKVATLSTEFPETAHARKITLLTDRQILNRPDIASLDTASTLRL